MLTNSALMACKGSANRAKCKINPDLFSFPRCSLREHGDRYCFMGGCLFLVKQVSVPVYDKKGSMLVAPTLYHPSSLILQRLHLITTISTVRARIIQNIHFRIEV